MLVTIDANVLIWGVRTTASAGDEHMIPRCVRFLEWLDECGHELVLTSQAVTEYLIGATVEERICELAELSSKYIILPYDVSAIEIAATLRSDKDFIKSLGDDALKSRVCVKADVIIVASAVAGHVQRIYSRDAGVRALAIRAGLSPADIPTIADMAPLSPPSNTVTPPSNQSPPPKSLFDSEDLKSDAT